MSSPKFNNNLMTTIKQQIESKNKRKYSNIKQQKNMTFYNLYKDKIITIQRWYRNCIVRKTRKLEKMILQKLKKRQHLLKLNEVKHKELKDISDKRTILMQEQQSQFAAYLERQIAEKLKKALKGTLDCAETLAQNNGKVKFILSEIKQCQNKNEQLEGEVQALKFQYNCHRKRKAEWQEKLFKIKENILNETLKTKDIKTRMNQISRPPLQQAKNVN